MAITSKQIRSVDFDDFDPNNFQQSEEVWALYNGSTFRTFSARPAVLGAMQHAHQAKLYWMLPSGQWHEVAVKGASSMHRKCDWCKGAVTGWGTPWVWRKERGKIPTSYRDMELLYLCGVCRDMNG